MKFNHPQLIGGKKIIPSWQPRRAALWRTSDRSVMCVSTLVFEWFLDLYPLQFGVVEDWGQSY